MIELVAVAAIIVIIAGIGMAYFSKNRKKQICIKAAEMLIQDIKLMMERAITLDAHYVTGDTVGEGTSVGIIFPPNSKDSYIIYEIDPITKSINTNELKMKTPGKNLGMPVIFTINPDSGHRDDRIYFLANSKYNWSGTITVNCKGEKRYIKIGQGSKINVELTAAP